MSFFFRRFPWICPVSLISVRMLPSFSSGLHAWMWDDFSCFSRSNGTIDLKLLMSFKRAALHVQMEWVWKWLILVFLGVGSFIRICPGCSIKSQQAVCCGSLSLSPGWACCGEDNCNVFLWPQKASNYHCKGPHRKGCGRSHFVSWAPLSSCCGTINTLVPFHCPHHQLDFSIQLPGELTL